MRNIANPHIARGNEWVEIVSRKRLVRRVLELGGVRGDMDRLQAVSVQPGSEIRHLENLRLGHARSDVVHRSVIIAGTVAKCAQL